MKVQKELFKPERQHDVYRDWYEVYKSEVTDRIKHWPSNRRMEMDMDGNTNEVMEVVVI